MINRTKQSSRLRDACQLTHAAWAVYIIKDGDAWQAQNSIYLTKPQLGYLSNFLLDNTFAAWIGLVTPKSKPKPLLLPDQRLLACSKLYAFPSAGIRFIIVGVENSLDSHQQGIWRITASGDEIGYSDRVIKDEENTILELQLTQQELQARINAQKDAETRLIQSAKLAAVGEMAAGVAHELNNPLTSVVGFTELVLEELPTDSKIRADLELVLQEARRARSVVRSLLDFARQTETVRVKADVNEIVNDVLMLTRHLIHANHIKLDVQLGENLKWALIDRNQIKQVVINLVSNALNAITDGGRISVITAEQPRYSRPWITLSVSDNGVGIPQEDLQRSFEPFFTTRGGLGGTGLGLPVTYGIVSDHGGMIEVESHLGVGSTFEVWLPLDQEV